MARSHCAEQQIAFAQRNPANRTPVVHVCHKTGVPELTYRGTGSCRDNVLVERLW
ncbi:hypothetical protein ACETIH_05415 [Microvirga arabica]|uniref:Transposase n=1 Tax=Microvirga arabica TaxID=1128671 RepID=A0ABV6Y595_9HYPH